MNVKNPYLGIRNKREIKYDNTTEEEQNKNDEVKPKEYKETEGEIKNNETEISEGIWQIEIPKINLVATIEESTTEQTMNKYVGHFESTEKWDGNVGLAAHNRRIPCQLFF